MLKRQFSSYNPADVACDTTSNPDQSEESEQISETRFDKSELVQNGSKRKRSQSFSLFLSPLNHHPETMKIFRDFEDIMAEEQRKREQADAFGVPIGGGQADASEHLSDTQLDVIPAGALSGGRSVRLAKPLSEAQGIAGGEDDIEDDSPADVVGDAAPGGSLRAVGARAPRAGAAQRAHVQLAAARALPVPCRNVP